MSSRYRYPIGNQLARVIMRPVFRAIFHVLSDVKITGQENIPYGKSYVAAINHVSLYDPPFALTFWPENIEAMGASVIWEKPGQNILVRLYGGIPVHRGQFDRDLFSTVLEVLESGHPLLIAPEGGRTRVPAMRRAKPGIAYIIDQARVPVVPVGIVGTTTDYWQQASRGKRPCLEMRIGQPLHLPPLSGRGEQLRVSRQFNADLVMRHIAGLLPENYRGVYVDTAIVP
ncbi:MAG: 1-acyl-sn-glycerol-3-phosphate acyltransferase [Anaerolineales bacterium]|nr:1-acyl-sn-glycerol-3-phosphate acyltransferase [Anaerolineales bacterium]